MENFDVIIDSWANGDLEAREAAAQALENSDAAGTENLIAVLQHENRWVRWYAARMLGRLGKGQPVPELLETLSDTDSGVRLQAALALGSIGAAIAVPTLVDLLRDDPSVGVRWAAAEGLVAIGQDAIVALAETLTAENISTRWYAILALERLGWQPASDEERVNALIARQTWYELAALGDAAVPALAALLDDQQRSWTFDDGVKVLAEDILRQIGTPAALQYVQDVPQEEQRTAFSQRRKALDGPTVELAGNAIPEIRREIAAEPAARAEDEEAADASDEDDDAVWLEDVDTIPLRPDPTAGSPLSDADAGAFDETEELIADNEAEESEPTLIAPPGAAAPAGPAPPLPRAMPGDAGIDQQAEPQNGQHIEFSAYYPKEIVANAWYPLYAYMFRQTAAEQTEADAAKHLGSRQLNIRRIVQAAKSIITEGTLITATPHLPGFQCNPPSMSLGFFEDWHRFDFKIRAKDAPQFQAVNGLLTFTVEGVIVADVPLSIFVGQPQAPGEPASSVSKIYEAIFASYSHDDGLVVERVERAYKALGLDYLRDVTTLKAGQHWGDELLKMIDKADIFQLFWSAAAAASPYVRQEWEYALRLDRDDHAFIRPVFWSRPVAAVPDELSHIHFSYQPELDD